MTAVSDIDSLPPLREIIRDHDLRAEKKLGQNFLLDLNLTQKIARAGGDLSGCHVFEIGPGPGGLTRALLKTNAARVSAVEFDPRAVAALESLVAASRGRLDILAGDALAVDITALPAMPRAVVANLPYNIATPLLIGWLEKIAVDAGAFQSLTLMFQKEVAQRIVAAPGSKMYGRLSVMTQWLCRAKMSFDIAPSAFVPPPKVVSTVVHLVPRARDKNAPSFATMEKVTAAAFGQRRKMIRTTLKPWAGHFEVLGLNPESRAEELAIKDYIALAMIKDLL